MQAPVVAVLLALLSLSSPAVARAQAVHAIDEVVLHGGDAQPVERRGVSVASSADGQRVIVGSVRSGARIFVRVGHDWRVEHEALPRARGEQLGASVAMSADGTVALVGAPNAEGTGLVRVLERFGPTWSEMGELRASDGASGDALGAAVAISADGRRALVGAPGDDSPIDDAGSAHIFVHAEGGWVEEATLLAVDAAYRDGLGASVALSGDGSTALVGAPRDDVGEEEDAGCAHVFALGPNGWSGDVALQPQTLRRDLFGASVALSADGRRALIGAPGDDVTTRDAGSARVFSFEDGGWREDALLVGRDGELSEVGASVALSADGAIAVVGAPRAEQGAGVGWVFGEAAGWRPIGRIAAREAGRRDRLGTSAGASSDGQRVVLGAPGDALDTAEATGSARTVALVPGDGTVGWSGMSEVRDVSARFEHATPSSRTPEQESAIRTGGIGAMIGGGLGLAGGVAMLIASAVDGLGCSLSSIGCDSTTGLLIGGGSLAGLGAIALIVGGIVFSQRTRPQRSPRLAVDASAHGAYVALTLEL